MIADSYLEGCTVQVVRQFLAVGPDSFGHDVERVANRQLDGFLFRSVVDPVLSQ